MKCTKCTDPKIPDDFAFKNKAKGIRSTVCKACQRAYKLKHYYANKQQHYDRNEKTRLKLKAYSNNIKSKGCSLCSEKNISCMDFHHLRDKDEAIALIINKGSIKRLMNEINKCVVLCANCHRKVHAGHISIV